MVVGDSPAVNKVENKTSGKEPKCGSSKQGPGFTSQISKGCWVTTPQRAYGTIKKET